MSRSARRRTGSAPPHAQSIAAAVALVVAGALPGLLVASLSPRIRTDFAFSDSALGLALFVHYAMCAVASVPGGRLVERVGARAAGRIACTLLAAAFAVICVWVDSPVALTLALAVAGAGNAITSPAASALLHRNVHASRHGFAFSAQQSGGPLTALLAGLALPLIALPLGWRWAFGLGAVLSLAVAAATPRSAAGYASSARKAVPQRVRTPRTVLGLALTAALASTAAIGFISFIVLYATRRGLTESEAGTLLAAVSAGAILARMVLGVRADKVKAEPLRLVAMLLAASALGYALLIVDDTTVFVIAALLAGTAGWSWPGMLNLAVVRRQPEATASATAVMMVGLFAGALVGPLLIGLLAHAGHFSLAWSVCAAVALTAMGTLLASAGALGGAEDDKGLRSRHAAAAPDLVDHALEVREVPHA
jgi:predicted MFS family arabinose efflux permease